jgi:hypothetical protein
MSYEFPDVDTLMEIAKNDPDALDRIKQQAVEDLITSAGPENQQRLRGLQWQVDMELKMAKNPMAGCIRISEMMHEKLWDLRAALQEQDHSELEPMYQDMNAQILPFRS